MTGRIVLKKRLDDSGEWVENPEFFVEGIKVPREEFHAVFPESDSPGLALIPSGTGWPKFSEALACHPDQVTEHQARADKAGVVCTYTPRGDVMVPDRGNWKKLLKLERMHERS